MKKRIYNQPFHLLIFLLSGLSATAQTISGSHPAAGQVAPPAPHESITFIQNKGQWDAQIKYRTAVPYGAMFLTGNGFVYNYISAEDAKLFSEDEHDTHDKAEKDKKTTLHFHAYKVNFVGSNPNAKFLEEEKQSQYYNYFIGKDRSKWQGNVRAFNKLTEQNIYNGIDLATYSQNKTVKYDFIVAPGADPNQIKFSFDGVKPSIDAAGNLNIKTSVNEI